MSHTDSIGALFLIADRDTGREVFLGRATGESTSTHLAVEGKALLFGGGGEWTVQPFATRAEFRLDDAHYRIQRVDHPDVVDEVTRILTLAVAAVTRESSPLLSRWFAAQQSEPTAEPAPVLVAPLAHVLHEFRRGAERLRAALLVSPRVDSTRELVRLAELEADLTLELGRAVAELSTRLHASLAADNELAHFLRRVGAPSVPRAPGREVLAGYWLLAGRLGAAKQWALGRAATELVRELGGLAQQADVEVGRILMEHQAALDALACEAYARYGLSQAAGGGLGDSGLAEYGASL